MNQAEFFFIKKILTTGGIIAYPTETVYGLGCDPFREEALDSVLTLKGRKSEQVPLLLIPNREWLDTLTREVPSEISGLIDTFWPGPLTIVLPAKETVPRWLRHRDGTVAVRISSHPWVEAFLSFYRQPIVSTSANVTGKPPAHSLSEIKDYFPHGIDYFVDGGALPRSKGSTIISFDRGCKLIREGAITYKSLTRATPANHCAGRAGD